MAHHPVVGMHADPVEHQPPAGARHHPARRVVVAHVVQGHQLHGTRLDGLARGRGRHRRQMAALAMLHLHRVARHQAAQLRRQGAEVVQQVEVPPAAHDAVVGVDEVARRQFGLGDLQRAPPAGLQLGVDALALHVLVDQAVAVRQARHELARVQVHDVHVLACGPGRPQHAETLQEHPGVVGVPAVARAREVHGADGAGLGGQVGLGHGALERLAVEPHRHRKPGAQFLDALCEVRQVDAVQLDPGTCHRVTQGALLDLDQCLGQRGRGVDVDAAPARRHHAARGGVQALREPDAEGALLRAGVGVPARLVEAEQLLEVVQAVAIVLHGQGLCLRIVVDPDQAGAGTARVLQQLGHQGEPVAEGMALVAQRAFFVDSDLDLHR